MNLSLDPDLPRVRKVNMRRGTLLLLSALLFSGCSAFFVTNPPPGDGPLPEGSCTYSYLIPAVDLAMAGLWTGAALAVKDSEDDGALPVFLAAALVQAMAATESGFPPISECRRRQSMSEEAVARQLRATGLGLVRSPQVKMAGVNTLHRRTSNLEPSFFYDAPGFWHSTPLPGSTVPTIAVVYRAPETDNPWHRRTWYKANSGFAYKPELMRTGR